MPQNNQERTATEGKVKRLTYLVSKAPTNTAVKSIELAKKPIYILRQNQVIAGVVGTAGLIIFALGVENWISTIPVLSSPFIMIGLGLFLLVTSGLYLKKLL